MPCLPPLLLGFVIHIFVTLIKDYKRYLVATRPQQAFLLGYLSFPMFLCSYVQQVLREYVHVM